MRVAGVSGLGYNHLMPDEYCYRYPRPAVTVDIVVLAGNEAVLLVERKAEPFNGWWALPGGFVDIDETLADAAARELEEETGLAGVAMRQLRAFDDPDRDPRGRTIAIAFLATVAGRPEPRAGSDAALACWHSLDRLPRMAFDHDRIIAFALEVTLGSK